MWNHPPVPLPLSCSRCRDMAPPKTVNLPASSRMWCKKGDAPGRWQLNITPVIVGFLVDKSNFIGVTKQLRSLQRWRHLVRILVQKPPNSQKSLDYYDKMPINLTNPSIFGHQSPAISMSFPGRAAVTFPRHDRHIGSRWNGSWRGGHRGETGRSPLLDLLRCQTWQSGKSLIGIF